MTEPIRPELRAQESGVEGHSYDTDDRIGDFDIYEALVNPHDESGAGAKKGGAGGPGMMPMGQGGAGAGGVGPGAAAGRPMTAAGAKGTSAAGAGGAAGMGAGGFGSAGSADAGIGAGGLGASGLSGLGGAGGLGGRLPTGAGSSWSPSTFGTSAAGMDPIDPSTIPPYGTPTIPGGSVPSIPTPGSSTFPTIPTTPGGSSAPVPGGTSPSAPTLKTPTMPGVGAGGGAPSMGGAGGPGSASTGAMGEQVVQASPEMLRKEAQAWEQVAQDMQGGVTDKVSPLSPSVVDFGMMKDAYPSYNDVLGRIRAWATSAGAEFSAISQTLNSAASGYAETDATNTSAATTIAT